MNETRKLLLPLVNDELLCYSLEELAEMYQETNDSKVFATAYEKTYKLVMTINNKYWGLSEDDKDSFYLEKLDYCLKTYKQGNKFSTYFHKVYSNKLREQTERITAQKRKGILVSINDLINLGIEDTYNIIELILPNNLTDKEHTFCILASEGFDNNYIAKELNVSVVTVYNIIKSLKNKLSTLQN